ncbi:hypothetical protein ACTXG7_09215 [Mycolicibacterium sp. Dal123E01]|uniref:hypothetical protein n=1 Tax=Mycolicibacterium sp. Dal123E01 TaxID=3457578 RepID=UPI00403E36EE
MTITMNARLGLGMLAVSVAFFAAPAAWADPADAVDPAGPTVVAGDPSTPPVDAPAPAPVAVPVQHLSSPDNLPPGTTATDIPSQGRLGYWRDLLHAMRTQQVSGSDALLLLTQRPLDADAAPPPGMSASPSGPVGTSAVAPVVDAAAPAPTG